MTTEQETLVLDIQVRDEEARASLSRLERAANQLTAQWGDVVEITEKLTQYYGRLAQSANAYIATDARLSNQLAQTQRNLEGLDTAFGGLLVSISGYKEGAESATSLTGDLTSALTDLSKWMDTTAKSGDGGRVAIEGIKTALSALLLGPLTGATVAFRIYNAVLGDSKSQTDKLIESTNQLSFATRRFQILKEEENKVLDENISAQEALDREMFRLRAQASAGNKDAQFQLDLLAKGYDRASARYVVATLGQLDANGKLLADLERLKNEFGIDLTSAMGVATEASGGVGDGFEKARERASGLNDEIAKLTSSFAALQRANQTVDPTTIRAEVAQGGSSDALTRLEFSVDRFKQLVSEANETTSTMEVARLQAVAQTETYTSIIATNTNAVWSQVEALGQLATGFAGLAIQTLIAGESMSTFGLQSLASLGNFATQAGQTLLWTGIGLEALAAANPAISIVAGASLIAIGAAISGLASRATSTSSRGSGQSPVSTARGILDSFASRNPQDREDTPITVIAQFGSDRLEPTVVQTIRSAQRNGRLPSPRRV